MQLLLQVETSELCGFKIKDITSTENDTGYLNDTSKEILLNRFKYKDTVSICILKLFKVDGTEILDKNNMIIKSNSEIPEEIFIPTNFDGHFELNYIILPNKNWFETNKEKLPEGEIYYSDGEKIYKYIDTLSQEVTIEEIIERNVINTSISIFKSEYISICYLKKCFIDKCILIFESRCFNDGCYKGTIDKQLLFNRDLLWMSINMISYLTEFGLLNEALRILELIYGCNGICQQRNIEENHNECGCS